MAKTSTRTSHHNLPNYWPLQTAKSRFSELIRKVKENGPQHVTVHGREEVVVISRNEYQRLQGAQTGQALIDAFKKSPHPEIKIMPERGPMPVRNVVL